MTFIYINFKLQQHCKQYSCTPTGLPSLLSLLLPSCSESALIEDDEDKEEPAPLSAPKPAAVPVAQSAIDLTAEFLHPLLNPENVANLVSSSRPFFPSSFPSFNCVTLLPSFSVLLCLGAHQHGVSAGRHASILPGHIHACGVGRH